MNYASAGIGSVSHLNFEVFKDGTGMEAVHVPYKGGGQAIQRRDRRPCADDDPSVQVAKSLVEGGKVKGLGGDQPWRARPRCRTCRPWWRPAS